MVVQNAVVFVPFPEICLEVVAVVVCLCAVGRSDGQGIIEVIGCVVREIAGFLAALTVDNLLDIRILGGADAQAAAVEHIVGLVFGPLLAVIDQVELLVLHIADDLADQCVDEVGVDAVVHFFLVNVDGGNRRVNILGESRLVLFLCDIALREHMLKNDFLTGLVVLGENDRIICSRILCDTCQYRALGKRQVLGGLIEVAL